MKTKLPLLLSLSFISAVAGPTPPESWKLEKGVTWQDGEALFESRKENALSIDIPPATLQAWDMTLKEGAGAGLFSLTIDGKEEYRYTIRKAKGGEQLSFGEMERDAENPERWKVVKGKITALPYRPSEKATMAWKSLETLDLKPEPWSSRKIQVRVVRRPHQVEVYVDGVLIRSAKVSTPQSVQIQQSLPVGDVITPAYTAALETADAYVPLLIRSATGEEAGSIVKNGEIPFRKAQGSIDLRQACWPFAQEMPSSYFAAYDSGPMFIGDPRVPTLWAPVDDYKALHLVVKKVASSKEYSDRFSIRVGRFGAGPLGGREQVIDHVYHATVPQGAGEQLLTVPITESIAQDLTAPLQISFNKEMRLARRAPDASRFEYRPLGLPAGVEIVAATLERSPLQWKVQAAEPGSIFEGEKKANYKIILKNTSEKPLDYSLDAVGSPSIQASELKGELAAGEEKEVTLAIKVDKWGFFEVDFHLRSSTGELALRRRSSFALLPPDERKHRASSPFGTWTFGGGHKTCDDPAVLGSLLTKAGLRYGMGQFPKERQAFGIRNNFEAKGITTKERYEEWQAKNPDALPVALLMHEHSLSADHVLRVPDALTGRKPYKMNEKEKERFDKLWEDQIAMARLMREHFPSIHLRLGNGPLPTKEEFLRAKFPTELFDSIGNEAGTFGRPPEAQPPDYVANNASLWMDHELLKAYGYDKPVTQCYEIIYPSTNPGNLSPQTQAAYFVRHAMHSLAWGVPEIRFGCLDDVANAYRFSNWGASGLVYAWPHLNPKPAYVAVATMTRMLDGAVFKRSIESSSRSLYALEFAMPDGQHTYVLWTLRGKLPVDLQLSGTGWQTTNWEANNEALNPASAKVVLSEMPLYITGKGALAGIVPGQPEYDNSRAASTKPVASLATLDEWIIEKERDPTLELHNPLAPRRPGNFKYSEAPDEKAIAVEALEAEGNEIMPMYGALKAQKPLVLPEQASEITLEVEGNSGWGRVIYELEDASGQKWISIGASRKGEASEWMLDWMPAEFSKTKHEGVTLSDWNTNDVFGLSAINYDGWRRVRFPLPGNYPGESVPWPANSQWRWDGDGVVHYPLKLTRLIFEFPKNVLKLTSYKPVEKQNIKFRNLEVEFGTQGGTRDGIYE